ncbi:hypothetical protein M4914_21790 [Streptomyces somaliensis DSM 40738]|uniref:hypothetical protein n=1 Tax=Streptomyces somaliensis TaxID=78355 RepID=UPI0021C34549|nr:hypothetical protein [Streptomyces somaliensis]MCQ0025306.1 hypothetical protein [Streptomyces somaliensis DSM 40738]
MTKKTPRSRQPVRAAAAVLGGALLAVVVRRRSATRTAERHRAHPPRPEPAGTDAERRPDAEPDDVRVVAPGTPPAPVAPPPGPAEPPADPEAPHHRA